MAIYSINLPEDLETALEYNLENVNVQRAAMFPPLDALTLEELLQERVSSDLQSVLNSLDSVIQSSLSNLLVLKDTNPSAFDAVLDTIESPATLARVNQLTA